MIFPNATVSVTRKDALVYPRLRVQINLYAGDSASGGRRGSLEGSMSVLRHRDIVEGDQIVILKMDFQRIPPTSLFTAGVVAYLGFPAPHTVVPIYGGFNQG